MEWRKSEGAKEREGGRGGYFPSEPIRATRRVASRRAAGADEYGTSLARSVSGWRL